MDDFLKLAEEFGAALVEGRYGDAEAMLAPSLRQRVDAAKLRDDLLGLFAELEDAPQAAELEGGERCDDPDDWPSFWPPMRPGDIGWALLRIEGEETVETATLLVAAVDGVPMIRLFSYGELKET